MRALRIQLIALLAAVLVLLSGAASARAQYLCHMTGRVQGACCCAVEGATRAAPRAPQARAADCCERIVVAARAGLSGTQHAFGGVAAAPLLAVLPAFPYSLSAAQLVGLAARLTRAPPALGPPLFVTHCALLI